TTSTRWPDTCSATLLRNTGDAEDAVQECYLRALRHFDTFRGPAIKPWLFAILRNASSRAAPAAYTTLINTLTAKRTRRRTLLDLCGRSRSSRQKQKCCTSGTHKQSAVSLQSFPTSFGRRSSCAKSTICPIARLPTWSGYRSER